MSRNGKIATLPQNLREEINVRLDNGQEGDEILAWLNPLPEVKKHLKIHFAGALITKQNLSEWRHGGFREWLAHEEFRRSAWRMVEYAEELPCEENPLPAEGLAMVLTARYCALVANWDGQVDDAFKERAAMLRQISQDVIRLQRSTRQAAKDLDEYTQTLMAREEEGAHHAQKKMADWLKSNLRMQAIAEQFGGGAMGKQIAKYIIAADLGLPETPLDLVYAAETEKAENLGSSPSQSKPVQPENFGNDLGISETPIPPTGAC